MKRKTIPVEKVAEALTLYLRSLSIIDDDERVDDFSSFEHFTDDNFTVWIEKE